MPTAIHQQQQYTNMMTPPYSTTNMIKSSNKTQQPTILKATVISFEKRASDQKIWYTMRIEPFGQQKKYLIQKSYEDFSQFSQKLHERFSSNQQQNLAGSRSLLLLPPKIKNRSINLFSNNKQIHAQRVQELNQFLNALFHYKQSIVTDSFTVLEFFAKQQKSAATDLNVEKSNYLFINDEQQQQQQQYAASTTTMEEEDGSNMMVVDENTNTNNTIQSRWKRLRCTSFLAKQGQQQQSIPSSSTSNGLSSLCSQAANKIMPSTWHHRHNNISSGSPQASISTPASKSSATTTRLMTANKQQQQLKHVLKKSKSTLGIYNSSTNQPHPLDQLPPTPTTPTTPTSSTKTTVTYNQHQHQIKNTIKIKVIYDVDNIIVIQVPRSISLVDLRSRIAQKFSDPASSIQVQVKHDLVLLFHDNSSSCCSIATSSSTSTTGSSAEEQQQMILPAVLIQKEQDLKNIMNTKWNRLEKVTLRCIM